MSTDQRETPTESAEPELVDLDAFTSYEKGDAHVICDRENSSAWLQSDVTRPLDP